MNAAIQVSLYRHQLEKALKDANERFEEKVYERTQELELANAALKKSEADRREAQRLGRLGHWSLDGQTGRLYWCEEVFEIFGIEPVGFSPTLEFYYGEIVHPEDRLAVKATEQACYSTGREHQVEHRFLHQDGSLRWVNVIAAATLDQRANPTGLHGTIQDITDRKFLEGVLRDREERLTLALQAATYDLVLTDIIMPEKEGIETIIELRRRWPLLRVIAMSGGGRINATDYLTLARKLGVYATLEKPFSGATLVQLVAKALQEA